MNTSMISRSVALLSEALDLLDRADAPPEFGARLQELIQAIDEALSGSGEGRSRREA